MNLDHLRILEDNWDRAGAKAPTDEAIDLAERILSARGNVYPEHNGGVRIEWHCEGAEIAVGITPDGELETVRWP